MSTIADIAKVRAGVSGANAFMVDDDGLTAVINATEAFVNLLAPVEMSDAAEYVPQVAVGGDEKFVAYFGGPCLTGTPYPNYSNAHAIDGTIPTLYGYWHIDGLNLAFGSGVTKGCHALTVADVEVVSTTPYEGSYQHNLAAQIGAFAIKMWNKDLQGAQAIMQSIQSMLELSKIPSPDTKAWMTNMQKTLGVPQQ